VSALKYRSDIDGLRALAVLSVVIYHVSPQRLPGGFLGVDIFFVISGYLISLLVLSDQANGTFSFADFYSRRIRRLFPALATVLLATLAFGAFALFADEYRRLGKHAAWAITFLVNFQFMNEAGYFDVVSDSKPLLHLWSLSVEEQFYVVWPALLVVLHRCRWPIGLIVGPLIAGSLVFAIYLSKSNLDELYFHPLARFWELMLGAALAYGHHRFRFEALPYQIHIPGVRHLLSLAGLAAICIAFFFTNAKNPHPGLSTLVPLLGVVALIASGGRSVVGRLLALKPMVWIGLISYPLYLWHWPLLSYVRIMESGSPPEALLWGGAGVAVLLAALTYRYIELPIRYALGVRQAVWGLGSTMMVLFVVSLSVLASNGFPDRSAVSHWKVAEAQMKRDPATDESCLSLFPIGDAPVYCRQHQPMEQMIAVVGDSHAHVLFPGISEIAASKGYGTILLANSGCPPLVGAVIGRNANEKIKCMHSIDRILNALDVDKRIVAVVLATRGPQYITGTGFGPVEANYNYPPIAAKEAIEGTSSLTPEEVFARGIRLFISRINQRGIPVVYLLQVPELGVPAQSCVRRPLTLTSSATGCQVSTKVHEERMRTYRALIANLELDQKLFLAIDPKPVFCDRTTCSGVRNDQLLYADDNHLSILGSKTVAPLILQSLFALPAIGAQR